MILRLSQKLAKKLKVSKLADMPLDENLYDDWSCHLFTANRTQYVILSNTKSLYSCVMYGKGITNDGKFIERALSTIREFMEDDGQAFVYQRFIAPSSSTVSFAKALNRKVTGSMNELVMAATQSLESGEVAPHDVGFYLNDILLSAIATKEDRGYGRPKDAFKLLAGSRDALEDEVECSMVANSDSSTDPWFVYIVRCDDDSLYTGITKDVNRRVGQHNAGTASRYTRSRLPVVLEYQENQPNQSTALKRELAIKALSRKAKEALIQSMKE